MMSIGIFFAFDPDDSAEIRLEKFSILLVAGACSVAGLVWAGMYYFLFGWGLTAQLPLAFAVILSAALIVSHVTKNHMYAVYTQIIVIMYITAFIQWSIGGIFESGFVMAWAFIGPITALMFFSIRKSAPWFLLYVINLIITVAYDEFFTIQGVVVAENIKAIFFIMNLGVSSLVIFIFAAYFVSTAVDERQRANNLLLNVLPKEIAEILKTSQETIADHFDSVSVLFADIVGSTPLFAGLAPTEVVDWLNEVFSALDDLAEKYGIEKLRTMGDGYMVAAGMPTQREDHAQAIAKFALEMLVALKNLPERNGKRIEFRIGINSGPVVAGVIGKSKFHYDVWGDTVNVASRMESHGVAGKIQMTAATRELLKDEFDCEKRGVLDIKGKGQMETWFLLGRKKD